MPFKIDLQNTPQDKAPGPRASGCRSTLTGDKLDRRRLPADPLRANKVHKAQAGPVGRGDSPSRWVARCDATQALTSKRCSHRSPSHHGRVAAWQEAPSLPGIAARATAGSVDVAVPLLDAPCHHGGERRACAWRRWPRALWTSPTAVEEEGRRMWNVPVARRDAAATAHDLVLSRRASCSVAGGGTAARRCGWC